MIRLEKWVRIGKSYSVIFSCGTYPIISRTNVTGENVVWMYFNSYAPVLITFFY